MSAAFGTEMAPLHAKASPFVFRQALYGNDQPNGQFSVVDVRDVALAHVLAMTDFAAAAKSNKASNDCRRGLSRVYGAAKLGVLYMRSYRTSCR